MSPLREVEMEKIKTKIEWEIFEPHRMFSLMGINKINKFLKEIPNKELTSDI
jgi:hypothetical protein